MQYPICSLILHRLGSVLTVSLSNKTHLKTTFLHHGPDEECRIYSFIIALTLSAVPASLPDMASQMYTWFEKSMSTS